MLLTLVNTECFQVSLVINYDLPLKDRRRRIDFGSYLHRIGYTGRFRMKGVAMNLVNLYDEMEMARISEIEDRLDRTMILVGSEDRLDKLLKMPA